MSRTAGTRGQYIADDQVDLSVDAGLDLVIGPRRGVALTKLCSAMISILLPTGQAQVDDDILF
ncbi:hypothetical protein WBO78_24830 [Bosea sp. CCNWLW174]|uniref:hypothetical protein n=1 Tax=unclassified Bosea (in: a-proteobacteria) TaxID=2653178 RepID=UPI003014DB0C